MPIPVAVPPPSPQSDQYTFRQIAVNGAADLIVSGDADPLALYPFRDIPIVSPPYFSSAHGSD